MHIFSPLLDPQIALLTLEQAPDFMLDYEAGEMQIGQVSQNTGLSIDTIRFFEKQGLVHPRTIWSIGVDDILKADGPSFASAAERDTKTLFEYRISISSNPPT
jgi:hypothetical protein